MIDLEFKNNLRSLGIEVITSGDTGFELELLRHIEEFKMVLPLVEAAVPLVGFIKNNSSKEVVGISLRWAFLNAEGEEMASTSDDVFTPGVLMGIKPRDPWMVGKTSLINPRESRFFSYFPGVTETIENIHKRVKYRRTQFQPAAEDIGRDIAEIQDEKRGLAEEGVAKLSVSFDGMFFDDGLFVGDNQNFYFEMMGGTLQARKDSLATLREVRATGKTDAEILKEFLAGNSEMVSQIENAEPERQAGVRFADEQDAFNQGYKSCLKGFEDEIANRKTRFPEKVIIDDYLETKDEDFIDIHRGAQ